MFKVSIQSKILLTIFFRIYVPIIILLTLVILVSLKTGIPLETFTRDPAAVAGEKGVSPLIELSINPFLGIISSLGILFWCVSATVCFFSFFITIPKKHVKKSDQSLFLGFFGLITLILLFDDLFLFHETIAPYLLFIPEKIVYACYGVMVLFGIIRFRKVILQSEWIILCLAFMFFFLSLVIDSFPILSQILNILNLELIILEDGFKFLGIASWVSYFAVVSFQVTKNFINSERKSFISLPNRDKLTDV